VCNKYSLKDSLETLGEPLADPDIFEEWLYNVFVHLYTLHTLCNVQCVCGNITLKYGGCYCVTCTLHFCGHCRDCNRYGRIQQLNVLRAIYELTGNKYMSLLRDRFDIDVTGS